jgi:N-acetylglucosaminyl-diphospho-decaprenol L-rhamnosyltransferase
MKVSIIIVNYNTSGLLKSCVDSINYYEKDIDKEFIIVDNNSEDNAKEIIESLVSNNINTKSVSLDSNYGFAYSNNRGYEVCTGEYILILNPDVLFIESLFNTLIEHLKDNRIGAIGAKLYGEDGNFQKRYYQKQPALIQYLLFYSVLSKPFLGKEKYENRFLNSVVEENKHGLQEVIQIPGAFMFMKNEVYTEKKGFNETFFLFFEDVDLSFRISKKYKLYIADRKVKHIGASSMLSANNKIYGYFVISMLNFYRINYSVISYMNLKVIILINTLLKLIIETVKRILGVSKPGIMEVQKIILRKLLCKNG